MLSYKAFIKLPFNDFIRRLNIKVLSKYFSLEV